MFVPSWSITRAFDTDHEYGVLWASATAADATRAPTETSTTTIERFMWPRSIWEAPALCLSYARQNERHGRDATSPHPPPRVATAGSGNGPASGGASSGAPR